MHMPIVVLPFSLSAVAFLPVLVGVALVAGLLTLVFLKVAMTGPAPSRSEATPSTVAVLPSTAAADERSGQRAA